MHRTGCSNRQQFCSNRSSFVMGYGCAQRSAREWIRTVLFYGEKFVESRDGLFLNFKLYLYTTSARIRNQENVELRIFNAPFLRGAKYDCPN